MKTFIGIIAAVLGLATLAFAGVMGAPTQPWLGMSSVPPSGSAPMGTLSAPSTNGPSVDLDWPVGSGSCTVAQDNGTSVKTLYIQAAADGTHFVNATNAWTVTPGDSNSLSANWAQTLYEYWRAYCASGCGVGNEVTVNCTFGGQQ